MKLYLYVTEIEKVINVIFKAVLSGLFRGIRESKNIRIDCDNDDQNSSIYTVFNLYFQFVLFIHEAIYIQLYVCYLHFYTNTLLFSNWKRKIMCVK